MSSAWKSIATSAAFTMRPMVASVIREPDSLDENKAVPSMASRFRYLTHADNAGMAKFGISNVLERA